MNDYELCKANGWGPGTRLIGDQGYGPTTIELTYISPQIVVAITHAVAGKHLPVPRERTWSLQSRNWVEVSS